MSSANVPGSKKKKKNEALDELFRAIQSNPTKVASIVDQNPRLCNMKSKPEDVHSDMSPGDFHQAEMLGYLPTTNIIHCLKKDDVPDVQASSQRPLHVACLLQEVGVIESLLSSGSDINATNDDGETPLGVACRAGLVNIAKLLLQGDASILPDSADKSGKTPITYLTNREAGSNGLKNPSDEEIKEVAYLMSKIGFERYRNEDGFEIQSPYLLERLKNIKDDHGWSPWKHAIDRRDLKVVKLFLKAEKGTQSGGSSETHSLGRDAQAFAEELGDLELAKVIASFCSPESLPGIPCGWRSFKSPEESAKRLDKVPGDEDCNISELINDFGKIKDAADVSWFHLLANNWRWLQLMLEAGPDDNHDESLLNHIEKKFELVRPLARGRDFFMGRNRTSPSEQHPEPGPAKKKGPSGGPSTPNIPMGLSTKYYARSIMTVLPIIDIDDLEEYGDPARDPHRFETTNINCKGLLPARTLDHYYQDDLDREALGKLNESQVFTRYLEKSRNHGNQPRRILVVSQFWLLKTNNSFVSSYPERRAKRRHKHCGTKTLDQNPELPEVLKRVFNRSRDPQVIYHDMIKKAMQYKPWIKIHDKHTNLYKHTTYLEIFSKDVQRISQETNECYDEFKRTLGISEKHFESLCNKATTCLLDIEDVCNEIKIIQRVLNDRKKVWRQYHRKAFRSGRTNDDDHSEDGIDKPSSQSCRWGVKNCRPDVVEASLRNDLLEIENTAGAVGDKVHGLVALLHGQASTENALRASEQARYLLIFTLLTVVFSPLSFVTSLLALQVESFTPPTPWAQREVTVACVVSVIATIILCILHVSWMKWCKDPCERLYEAVKNRLYEAVLKPYWQRLMACAHDFKKRRQGDGGNSGTRHSIASILSDGRGKASDDLENATVK